MEFDTLKRVNVVAIAASSLLIGRLNINIDVWLVACECVCEVQTIVAESGAKSKPLYPLFIY